MEEPMKTKRWIAGVAACLCLAATGAGAQSQTFTTNDFPGAVSTQARSVNALGEIVGWYTDSAGRTHGYVLSGGHFRSIDFPGAESTSRVLGRQETSSAAIRRAIQRCPERLSADETQRVRQGRLSGHQNTIAIRILPDGTIVGCYHDTDTMMTMHGFVLSRRRFDAMPEPTTQHNGATTDGQTIVGFFTDASTGGPNTVRRVFSPLEVPGSVFTTAWDVNAAGLIVGIYRDAAGAFFTAFGTTNGRLAGSTCGSNRHTRCRSQRPQRHSRFFADAAGRTHGFLAQWTRQ
jgi:hypothetical protein